MNDELGLEVQVQIDTAHLRQAGLMPEPEKDRQFAEHYRQIKRPLLARAASEYEPGRANQRVIMVASALPGDGKSFTSFNLAMSMARERDQSVLLIDGDVANPVLSGALGVSNWHGLMEALQDGSLDAADLILPTSVRGLSLLPAGKPDEGATELLASRRMVEIVATLLGSDPKRIILIDSPPLLISTEARALLAVVGQVVLVVRSAVTPRQAMLDALALVGAEKCTGLVLNDSNARSSAGSYGYGDYGYYADAGNK
jgi:exopolysaccharide/PEP-CTERM locus tyrosine autokinase